MIPRIILDKTPKSVPHVLFNNHEGNRAIDPIRWTKTRKNKPILKYTVEKCFIDLKKMKNIWLSDANSDLKNVHSDKNFESMVVDSNGFEKSPNSYEITEPACQSHQEVNQFDEFSCSNAFDIGQEMIIGSENLQEPFENNTISDEQENIENEHEFEQNSVIDTDAVQTKRDNCQSTINLCEIDQKRNTARRAVKSVQFEDDSDSESKDSGSSYQPTDSEEESIDEEDCLVEEVTDDENSVSSNSITGIANESNISQNTSTSTLNCSLNVSGHAGWDDDDVKAELSTNKGNSKKDSCCFCEKEYFKIARHLETVHKNESEVQSFINLKKGSSERKDKIAVLRKKGNHIFNMKQRKKEDGTPSLLKVVRCPNNTSKQGGGNFAVCFKCKGWYKKNNLRHHYRDCQDGATSSKGILAKARRIQGQIHERASKPMRHKILPYMKLTEHVKLIRYDLLIILFGNEECTKYRKRMLQRNKETELPSTADINRFSKFLDNRIDENIELLSEKFSRRAWRDLAEACLIQLQLFNRKRAGEMERFELGDYNKMKFITEKEEGYRSLSKEEKQRAKEYGHTVIQGKLYKSVPLLLSAKVRDGINVVVKYRKEARISSKNPFVFGISGYYKDAHLCASNVMRKLSELCGAKKPELLRGTPLRKQMATKCSEMQLDSTQTSKVADYLGHDVLVHKKVYQQRAKTDILNMSTILLKAQDPNDSRNDSKGSIEMNSTNNETDSSVNAGTASFNNSSEMNEIQDENNVSLETSGNTTLVKPSQSRTNQKKKKINHNLDDSKKISRKRWSEEEHNSLRKYFGEYLRTQTYPTLPFIKEVKEKYKILANRNEDAIKTKLSNIFKQSTGKIKKNNSKLTNKVEKLKNSESDLFKQHIMYIFDPHIKKGLLPTKKECVEAKRAEKVLKNVKIDLILRTIRKKINKTR
ncbi:hypothetical protein KQX54_012050 [Cotesia glomerata]|uniref:Uncharacterized protein n=1 Tax=Cotesia glomerata TaxID=32391 RepID=A0AAV7IYU6_COTGL|nr:hypothetical protein KQX54_012050 [Cotesia glomerata]